MCWILVTRTPKQQTLCYISSFLVHAKREGNDAIVAQLRVTCLQAIVYQTDHLPHSSVWRNVKPVCLKTTPPPLKPSTLLEGMRILKISSGTHWATIKQWFLTQRRDYHCCLWVANHSNRDSRKLSTTQVKRPTHIKPHQKNQPLFLYTVPHSLYV